MLTLPPKRRPRNVSRDRKVRVRSCKHRLRNVRPLFFQRPIEQRLDHRLPVRFLGIPCYIDIDPADCSHHRELIGEVARDVFGSRRHFRDLLARR
jgi:hypothetical protein